MFKLNEINILRAISRLQWLLAVAVCALALGAHAVEPDKVAVGLARQALQADDGGDPVRAAELYLQAFQADSKQPNYLYAAARAEMAAGRKSQAEEHLEQFLALADAGSDRADKARAYLADLRARRGESKETAAEQAVAAGKWQLASGLYEQLWVEVPTRWSALFKAGAAAQQAGDKDRAADLLRQYLRESPKSAADRPEAEDRLQQVASAHAPERAAVDARTSPDGDSAKGSRAIGWTVLGTGLALIGGGAGLLVYGVSEQHVLNQDLKLVDGYVTGDISHAQAQARADAIGMHQTLGVGLAAAGMVAAGVGTWLLLRETEARPATRVGVAPGPGLAGVALVGRF